MPLQQPVVRGHSDEADKEDSQHDAPMAYVDEGEEEYPLARNHRGKAGATEAGLLNLLPGGSNDTGSHVEAVSSRILFQSSGPLPLTSHTYVTRSCDDKIGDCIAKHRFVSVYGDFQIGKSSLLVRLRSYLNHDYEVVYVDMSGKDSVRSEFMMSFFEDVSEELEQVIKSWRDLYQVIGTAKVAFVFEEFGSMSAEVADHMLLSLEHIKRNYEAVAIIAHPKSMTSMCDVWKVTPRLANIWYPLHVPPFAPEEAKALISRLGEDISQAAEPFLDRIIRISGGNPSQIQHLCGVLQDSCSSMSADETIQSVPKLVQERRNYLDE